MLAKEGQFPVDVGPLAPQCREGGAAPGSPCRCRGGRDAGSRGTSRTSGAPLHGRPPRADARRHTSVSGSRPPRKVQLSAAASAMALISGRLRLICATSLASCAFSVHFRPSGMRPRQTVFRRSPSASWKETVPQAASRQQASERPSSPARSATMTPSSEAVTASCGMSSASRMSSRGAETFPALLHGQALQGAGVMAPSLPNNASAAAHHHQPKPPAVSASRRRGFRPPASATGSARRCGTPKGHRARSSSSSAPHLCPSRSIRSAPSSRASAPGISQRVHALTHPPLRFLKGLGRALRTELPMTNRGYLRDRLDNPRRQAGNIDRRGRLRN